MSDEELEQLTASTVTPKENLPAFVCHKTVRAIKISAIVFDPAGVYLLFSGGDPVITVKVSPEYITKHKPYAGGYYVFYEDGYESFSPADAFEKGYSLVAKEG